MITISINEKSLNLSASMNIHSVLEEHWHNLEQPFALALNGEFVPKSQYSEIQLNNGDALDIVSPVGGG